MTDYSEFQRGRRLELESGLLAWLNTTLKGSGPGALVDGFESYTQPPIAAEQEYATEPEIDITPPLPNRQHRRHLEGTPRRPWDVAHGFQGKN